VLSLLLLHGDIVMNIRKLMIVPFTGCGGCPAHEACVAGHLHDTPLPMIHTGNERWDNHGHIVPVFSANEPVTVEMRHDNVNIYCGTATTDQGVNDYINMHNFRPADSTFQTKRDTAD
jgi:hypothetical protein